MTSPEAGSEVMFVIFQGMFAIITPALITGAFVERFKFSTYLFFITIWSKSTRLSAVQYPAIYASATPFTPPLPKKT